MCLTFLAFTLVMLPTIVLPLLQLIESSAQPQQGGVRTHSFNSSFATVHCHSSMYSSNMCLTFLAFTLVMLRATQTCTMTGMAYTVGYIVHGPSQLASAV